MEDTKIRQDAWSHEDDLMLAETVLRHIREGSTQLNAFEEVGDKLNRTSAACGFRWNAELRNKYDKAVEIAKKQRKERQRLFAQKLSNETVQTNQTISQITKDTYEENEIPSLADNQQATIAKNKNLSIQDVIAFLENMNQQATSSKQLKQENNRLKKEQKELLSTKTNLEKKVAKLNQQRTTIKEDYQALIQIMDRARQMVFVDDQPSFSPAFQDNAIQSNGFEKMAE